MASPPPPPASAVENPISVTPDPVSPLKRPSPVSATPGASALKRPYPDSAVVEKPSAPRRQVSKFEDRYNLVLGYCGTFEFEFNPDFNYMDDCDTEYEGDTNNVANPRETLIKYVNQIRKSFGFDVDCVPPSWFNGAFHPVDLSEAKLYNKELYDYVLEATDCAVSEINSEMTGKSYELVEVEKAVQVITFKVFLTLEVKEVGAEAEAAIITIQAIVHLVSISDVFELLQWRFKPVDEDDWWYQPTPLHIKYPWLKPAAPVDVAKDA